MTQPRETSAPMSRAARAADAVTLACVAASLLLLLTGRFRAAAGSLAISIGWVEMLFGGLAIAAVRHAAVTRPSILDSLAAWRQALRKRPAVADALIAFWLTRPAVVLAGLAAVATIGVAPAAEQLSAARDPLRALPARWDAQWYAGIAADGYEWQYTFDRQQNLAFFPAYPLLMRATGAVAGAFRPGLPYERRIARLAWCGLVVSLLAFFGAAVYLSLLARELLPEPRARDAVVLLAAYPFAIFYSAAYTEALFLLAALATWYHFRRGTVLPTLVWGLLAGLSRPNGCFLSIPLGLLALGFHDAGERGADRGSSQPRGNRLSLKHLLLATAPGIGMLLFTVYLYTLTGVWFAWSRMHEAWGRIFALGSPAEWLDSAGRAGLLSVAVDHPYNALNAVGLLFALLLIRPVWRWSPAWAVFVLVNVLAPLSAGGLLSMGRITSTLFPLFLALAAILPSSAVAPVVAAFSILQGLAAALFYTWRDIY